MNKKILGKFLMVLLPISILIFLIFLFGAIKKKTSEMTLKPTTEIPTPTPQEIRHQSRWATDSGILEIEENLKTFSAELETVDLKESRLLPPVLDMEAKF